MFKHINLQLFAAGDPIAIVNSKIASTLAARAITLTAADQTTDATAQKFIYTPTGKDNKICIVFTSAAAQALTVTVAAGVGVFGAPARAHAIPATAGTYGIQIETGRHMLADGTIEISILPVAGKDLVNDHALTIGAIELQ